MFDRHVSKHDGVTPGALDSHNAFVEWGLSYGLLGMLAGVWLAWCILRKAREMDRREGSVSRQALLACFCLASMNYVTTYQLFFVAAGGLMLSMLSEAPAVVTVSGTAAGAGSALRPAWRKRLEVTA